MADKTEDAKTAVASSTTVDDKETQAAESSPEATQQSTQTEESLSDIVGKAAEQSLAREKAEEDRVASNLSHTEEEAAVDKEASDAAESKKTDAKPVEEADVPKEFNEHPAWKRILTERNEARTQVEQLAKAVKAEESLSQYCRQRNVSDNQFKQAMDFVSLLNTDPAKALERITPLVEQLESATGKRLPADLDAKVKEGILDPETASEIARLRADKAFATERGKQTAVEQQQAAVAQMVQGLNAWTTQKQSSDPDYERKSDLVNDRFFALFHAKQNDGTPVHPVRSTQDALALAEKAYTDVNAKLGTFIPSKPAKKALTSTHASTSTNNKKPTSTKEAVADMLREKHGIDLEEDNE